MVSFSEILCYILVLLIVLLSVKSSGLRLVTCILLFIGVVFLGMNTLVYFQGIYGYTFLFYTLCVVLVVLLCLIVWLVKSIQSRSIFKSKFQRYFTLLVLCIILSEALAWGYCKYSETQRLQVKSTSVIISSKYKCMQDESRAKQDLVLFLSIWDESSYQEAKERIDYNNDIQSSYFNSSAKNLFTGYSARPDVVIKSFGVEFPSEDATSLVYNYFATVSINSIDTTGVSKFESYFITMSYSDSKLIDLVRRKV